MFCFLYEIITADVGSKPKNKELSETEMQVKYKQLEYVRYEHFTLLLTTSVMRFAEPFNQTIRSEMACFSRRCPTESLHLVVPRFSPFCGNLDRAVRRHGVFVLGANVLLSAPLIRQDTGKQKNQHFDMVSMALRPCCEEHQTLGTAGDLCARLRAYWRGSRALTGPRLSYSSSVSNACSEGL